MQLKNFALVFLTIFAVSLLPAKAMRDDADQGELRIYSVVNEDETKALTDLFTQETGIRVNYLRAATGEIINRVIAEKNAPQADVLLGGAESLHISAAKADALEPYTSAYAASLPAYTYAKDGAWTGFCVLTLGIGVNEQRFREKFPGKAYPASWDDLADAAYKGELIFTDPVKSSTGYLFLQSQLQGRGKEQGWEYFRKITPLAAQLPASGGAPPQLIGRGEYAVCVAYVHALELYSAQGFPVKIIIPAKTVGEVDAVSVIKGGANRTNARRFVDFMLSKSAQELFSSLSHTIPVNPDAKASEGAVSAGTIDLLSYNSELAGAERDAVLQQWEQEIR
ncbi:MAG: ABC transporter substrate-binding protein [Treponema sp.]|jgi:iron(III) transport system substrate-binding protein|nr:ABC transporter substrate-binding protein [Treponema sp.]